MLKGLEADQTLVHLRGVSPQGERRGGCRKGVGCVVLAGDLKLGGRNEHRLGAVPFHDKLVGCAQVGGIGAAALLAHVGVDAVGCAHGDVGEAALGIGRGLELTDEAAHHVVGGVHDHGRAALGKVRVDLLLRQGVIFQAVVPLNVVGRDVQQNGHVRTEIARARKLIGGNLGNVAIGFARGNGGDAGVADVAHGGSTKPAGRKQMRSQGRRGGFTVGARNRQPTRILGTFAPGELHLAYHLGRVSRSGKVEIGELADAGAGDGQIVAFVEVEGVEEDARALGLDAGGELLSCRIGSARGNRQRLNARADETRAVLARRLAGFAQTKDQHLAELNRRMLFRKVELDWFLLAHAITFLKIERRIWRNPGQPRCRR